MILNNNIDLLTNLYKTQRSMDKLTNQLSTGFRVNKAADDPSSVVYSTRLISRINERESHLAGIKKTLFILESMQVAFASLQKITSELEKVGNAAINPLVSPDEFNSLKESHYKLVKTYDDITTNFEVDKMNLIHLDDTSHFVNTGYETIEVQGASLGLLYSEALSVIDNAHSKPERVIEFPNTLRRYISEAQEKYARIQNSLERYEELNLNQLANMKKDYSRIMDVNTAKATSELARLQILEENNLMLMQVNDSTNQLFKTLMEF